jgi:nucleoside diphosphate kinase
MSFEFENELRKLKSISKEEVGFAMIKPHFLERADEIQSVIEEAGLKVFIRQQVTLNEVATDFVLREVKQHHFYHDLKKFLMKNDVIVLAVKGQAERTQQILSSLKKTHEGKDGILREKFSAPAKVHSKVKEYWYNKRFGPPTEESQHKDPSSQELLSIIICMNNAVHTADSSDEAFENLMKIFDIPNIN